jgi:2-methylcitrate dehydratase PrpD
VLGAAPAALPPSVQRRLAWLILDLGAVLVAGRVAECSAIAARHASAAFGGNDATLVLTGQAASAPGAAWANGVLANALDFDDGHREVKGHPGAVVIPAVLAAGERAGAGAEAMFAAAAVGYEVAIRAGLNQHRMSGAYHGSGSWGAVGAAAAAARLEGLDAGRLRHALGLAEYHAPMTPSCAPPAIRP